MPTCKMFSEAESAFGAGTRSCIYTSIVTQINKVLMPRNQQLQVTRSAHQVLCLTWEARASFPTEMPFLLQQLALCAMHIENGLGYRHLSCFAAHQHCYAQAGTSELQ